MPENTPVLLRPRLAALGIGFRRGREAERVSREALASAIHEADAAGWSLRDIARAAELPLSTTHRLLTAEAARRQHITVTPED